MEAKKDNMPRIKELVSGRAVGVGLFVWGFFPHHLHQVIAKKFIWSLRHRSCFTELRAC